MPSITLELPGLGEIIGAGLHATNYLDIQTLLNGGLDDVNLSGITGAKITGLVVYLGTNTVSAADTDLSWGGGNSVGAHLNISTGGGSLRRVGAPTKGAGVILRIRNGSAAAVTIKHNDASGTGAKLNLRADANFSLAVDDAVSFVYDGTDWVEVARTSGGSFLGMQVFTSSGTYTPTAGTTRVFVECLGGGAGGGGVPSTTGGQGSGGGGGGGAYAAKLLTSAFSGKTVTIGTAGNGGAAGANPGAAGGDTTFDSTVVVAKGGSGGAAGGVNVEGAGGAGGVASSSTGDSKVDGGKGRIGGDASGVGAISGDGGDGVVIGGQGAPGIITATVAAGVAPSAASYGAGGSGAAGNANGGTAAGGNGMTGYVRIWEYS